MKLKNILAVALAVGVTSSASAQTVIDITGATAFRQATMQGIVNAFNSEGGALGTTWNAAHDFAASGVNNTAQLLRSNQAIFKGKFPGIVGETIIRTSFNGSTDGLNNIAGNRNVNVYNTTANLAASPGIQASFNASPNNTGNVPVRCKFAFSDVYQETSPVQNEVLQPAGASKVGVVTFAMVASRSATNSAVFGRFNNITQQHAAALASVGTFRLSLITGNTNDANVRVLLTGRNDGSGTRSAYLTEWQFGVAKPIKQYVGTATGLSGGVASAVTLVPIGANLTNGSVFSTGRSSDASTLWGLTAVGNGGFSSSSGVAALLTNTSDSVTIYNGANATPSASGVPAVFVSFLTTADTKSITTPTALAKVLAYNGEKITPLANSDTNNYSIGGNPTGFTFEDFEKITRGAYSAWSYQHLYYHGDLDDPNVAEFYTRMTQEGGFIEQGLQETANGVRMSDMKVDRINDGTPIIPL
jgi:hypothetical protein